MTPPAVGLYLYGWYDRDKWASHRFPLRPQVGFYRSGDPVIARWQVEQIARTGVDFVAFEMVPHSDHSFEEVCAHARNCIPLLAEHGIGYAMFIDTAIFQVLDDPMGAYAETLARLDAEGWLEGTIETPDLGRPLFHFAPRIHLVDGYRALAPRAMRWWPCTWQLEWGLIRPDAYSPGARAILDPDWVDALERNINLRQSLEEKGYFAFWTYNHDMPVMNGIAAVTVGYDDLMLERDPQLSPPQPHEDGRTLFTQFRNAQQHHAHTVMIYGWNEYFESAVIEPTIQSGDFYVRLAAHFIAQLKSGTPVSWPDWADRPELAPPLYLTPELERSGRRHADGLARWDQDDWCARLDGAPSMAREGPVLRLGGIWIENTGIKAWPIASAEAPIRLGLRLLDRQGVVRREGRADLGPIDIRPGTRLLTAIDADVTALPPGRYRAEIGIVWEDRMWFRSNDGEPLVLDIDLMANPEPAP